jgi:hypothetical protein
MNMFHSNYRAKFSHGNGNHVKIWDIRVFKSDNGTNGIGLILIL